MKRSKITLKEQARILMHEGEIIATKPYFNSCYVLVKAFGHTYRIDNPTDRKPTITQLCQFDEQEG